MIQDKIFFDEKDPTGLSYNTPFTVYGSYEGRLWSKAPGGEIRYYTQNSDLSVYATTGSNSFNGNQTVTGSLTVTEGITGTATTASYVEYAGVANKPALVSGSEQVSFNGIVDKPTLVSGSSQITYSGISSIPAGIVSSSAQVGGYGIFATTGSNQFNGSQAVTGSLTVTGQVVAQTLNVQQVTSSIVYSSGSNIFGNDLGNTQQFTGSLQVSGSSHYVFGNVGVGINNPGSTLVIRGDNYVVANSGRSLGGIDILTTSSPGTGGYGGAISLGANGSGRAAIATVQGTSDNDNQGLAFFTHGSTGASDSVERMRINSDGNVGIGTNNPTSFTGYTTLDINSASDGGFLLVRSPSVTGDFHADQFTGNVFLGTRTNSALVFRTNTTERMRITSGGNVGIGTTNPLGPLEVRAANRTISSDGILQVNSNNSQASDLGGSISFGGVYQSSSVTEWASVSGRKENSTSGQYGGYLVFGTRPHLGVITERMRITPGGFLKASNDTTYAGISSSYHEMRTNANTRVVAFSNKSATLTEDNGILIQFAAASPNNTTARFIVAEDTTATRFVVYSNGNVQNQNGSYGTIASDIRLKENIVSATPKLDDLLKLNVVNFNLIGNEEKHIGFIAQEMQEVFPSFVHKTDTREYDEDGNVISGLEDALGVKVGMEFAILVKAIQELKSENDTLKSILQRNNIS
jgi:hypothetical protein